MFLIHLTAALLAAGAAPAGASLTIDAPMPPPAWALLERELLVANTRPADDHDAALCKPTDALGAL